MPHVPLTFDYEHSDEKRWAPLDISDEKGLTTVRWRELALTLVHSPPEPEYRFWRTPNVADALAKTPGLRMHGQFGFTLGQYTEVLALQDVPHPASAILKMGTVELTLGEPTPLFRYLCNNQHDSDIHGEWEGLSSMRLWNCPPDLAEAYLLEGHAALARQHCPALRFYQIFEYDYGDEFETNSEEPIELQLPSAITDIPALRLYHDGQIQPDSATAILQFYRVLEYFSVVGRHNEVEALRRRPDLSSKEFTLEVAKVIGGEERSNICRMVASLADATILNGAATDSLIERADAQLLGNRLYDFRNSIVHAKQDQRTQMFVPSTFEEPPEFAAWRRVLTLLARAALD